MPLAVRSSAQPFSEIDRTSSQYFVSLRISVSSSIAAESKLSVAQSKASMRDPFITSSSRLAVSSSLCLSTRGVPLAKPNDPRGTCCDRNIGVYAFSRFLVGSLERMRETRSSALPAAKAAQLCAC